MNSRKFMQADKALWNAFLAGEENALGHIANKYYPKLAHVLLRYTHNETEVEDLVSDVFVRLLENRQKLAEVPVRNIFAFLIEMGKNLYFSNHRKHQRRRELLEKRVFPLLSLTDLAQGQQAAFVDDIYASIQRMPHPDRRQIILMLIEGYKAHEIAEAFGKTPKWAHQNIYLARRELKGMMG
jgi:RNA polymerase sigma factor (sigma-70 family)